MSSIVLRLFVLTAVLVVLSATSLERKRRFWGINTVVGGIKDAAGAVGNGVKSAAGAVGNGVKGAAVGIGKGVASAAVGIGSGVTGSFKWIFNIDYKEADTVEGEAEIIIQGTDTAIAKGNELVLKGADLLKKADELERSLGSAVGKRDDGDQSDSGDIRGFISALREAAQRSIEIGLKIAGNSEKIAAALKDAVTDISEVVSEGLVDVGGAFAEVTESVAKAGLVVSKAKMFADSLETGVTDAATQLQTASDLVVEATQSFEEVGKRSLNLVTRVFKLGKNLLTVFGSAAKNIVLAAGITGKK